MSTVDWSPWQSWPPCWVVGLLQPLRRVFSPVPQWVEHGVHPIQPPHWPSTTSVRLTTQQDYIMTASTAHFRRIIDKWWLYSMSLLWVCVDTRDISNTTELITLLYALTAHFKRMTDNLWLYHVCCQVELWFEVLFFTWVWCDCFLVCHLWVISCNLYLVYMVYCI